ncbi:hypothetical protein SERLA73DRAFT_79429 [Serpula lacrymans var. lacrymans S7.3]|uniref:Haloacid dehalogenase n=2 Tax=Serpula lacrymans var. lacrymans TaxID=341189 RepID=F8QGD5_SERL3|nr:uncharacterized protein SERLADRAFT_380833 [Serpula lacrymans var. lacrymans S7.9]EGN92613.1 hypothetical protein SERLA73DRAFT_79429 [Serpula lacrymans var. lacrymans S7.3]EGO28754.1 hypothetical protein SERLADRAFT_380833 [Serpula lacrymans var. lacrymans S7.9]
MTDDNNFLEAVEALVFDAFGTTVDWLTTVMREVARRSHGRIQEGSSDAEDFAREWRQGYMTTNQNIAKGAEGTLNSDIMHRDILDSMLASPRWSYLSSVWNESERQDLTLIWHHLDGFSDVTEGLERLKKHKIVVTLSNGNMRLLVDMAKHANLPWDAIFPGEMFGSFKPNPKLYHGAAYHLSLPPHKIAMVAAHIWDLRAAAEVGYKTIYVPRPVEDSPEIKAQLKTKKDGGEVDLIVKSFVELAEIVEGKN